MTSLEVIEKVLREHCRVTLAVAPETKLLEDLGLDSVGLLTLLTELENHYQTVLQEDFSNPPATVGALAQWLDSQIA